MDCSQIKKLLERYIDDELTSEERREVEAHLSVCEDCSEEFQILLSINSAASGNLFAEPDHSFWVEMNSNINSRIRDADKKESHKTVLLSKLKLILWPQKTNYRILGLAATAVMLVFIIHFSFFKNGDIDLSSILNKSKYSKSIDDLHDITAVSEADEKIEDFLEINEAEEDIGEPIDQKIQTTQIAHAPTPVYKKQAISESPGKRGTKTQSFNKIEKSQDKLLGLQKEAAPVISPPSLLLEKNVLTKRDKQKMKQLVSKTRAKKGAGINSKLAAQNGGGAKVVLDNGLNLMPVSSGAKHKNLEFDLIKQETNRVENDKQKIELWEKFIATNPDSHSLKKAKYEQALLYFNMALKDKNKKNINQSLIFNKTNMNIFESSEFQDSVKFHTKVLHDILKNLEKNKKNVE